MLNQYEYIWETKTRNHIFARHWSPSTSPKSIILLIHGLGEHSGRYHDWAIRFVNDNYAVLAIDLPGHGNSWGKKGRIKNYSLLIEAISLLIAKTKELFPGIPYVLYGHSMGGNLVLRYTIKTKKQQGAIIASSPWLKLSKRPSIWKILAARIIAFICPALTFPSGINADYLSHDKNIVKAYTSDPLVHDRISVSLFFGIQEASRIIYRNKQKINIPLLILHGSKDNITHPRGSKIFANGTGRYTTLRIWENGYHELHNDTDKDQVYNFIIQWIDKTITK